MLVPLYPPGHKRAGQRKADKDLTDAERRSQEDSMRLYHGRRKVRARNVLGAIEKAKSVLAEYAK